ncbi:hypothetical protein ACTA71_003157 [Dictyostelium dimigraforme]
MKITLTAVLYVVNSDIRQQIYAGFGIECNKTITPYDWSSFRNNDNNNKKYKHSDSPTINRDTDNQDSNQPDINNNDNNNGNQTNNNNNITRDRAPPLSPNKLNKLQNLFKEINTLTNTLTPTDRSLSHGSFSANQGVGDPGQTSNSDKENLIQKFLNNTPMKPSGETIAAGVPTEDVRTIATARYNIMLKNGISLRLQEYARLENMSIERTPDKWVDDGRFDKEIMAIMLTSTNTPLIGVTEEVESHVFDKVARTRIFMKKIKESEKIYFRPMAESVYYRPRGSDNRRYTNHELEEMLKVNFVVGGKLSINEHKNAFMGQNWKLQESIKISK